MNLETLLKVIRPGHLVRLDQNRELEIPAEGSLEWLLPEGHAEREVGSLRFLLEPEDPGIRLMCEIGTCERNGAEICLLEDLLRILKQEEEAEVRIRRGRNKLGHASPCRIGSHLSCSVLESRVRSVHAYPDREWDMVLDIEIC